MYDGGEMSHDYMVLVLSSFHYSNKKYEKRGKTFESALIFNYVLDYKMSPPVFIQKTHERVLILQLSKYDKFTRCWK
jgi:hypothetical protein